MKSIKRNADKRSISEEERGILLFIEAFSLLCVWIWILKTSDVSSQEIFSLFSSIDRVFIPKDTLIVEPGQSCSMFVSSLFSLISIAFWFFLELSTSPKRERKSRSGRVPPLTPSCSFRTFYFSYWIHTGKAFSYHSFLILVDHCTCSDKRGNVGVYPSFSALDWAAQNRLEFGQHSNQSNATSASLRRSPVRFHVSPFMGSSLSTIMGVTDETPAPLGILFPELAKKLSDESVSLKEIEKIAGGDGDMVLSLRKHKMVAIPPYTMYVVAPNNTSESWFFTAESFIPRAKSAFW